jgi:NhaP-type Na+/H+ or K+/H+ antiporter
MLTFIIYSSLTVLLFTTFTLWKFDPNAIEGEDPYSEFKMSAVEIMLFCSILCSSDIIAAVTIIKFEDQPKLFSIILGEGLFNDAVAIILYQTMIPYEFENAEFEPFSTPFLILGDFVRLFVTSILIGVIFGFLASYITKSMRFIAQSAIGESFILICFGMFSYFLSEILEMSGIVSLLTTALVMAHYAWQNLSPQGKHVTSVTF